MTHYWATITVFIVIAAMAYAAERADRYQRLADQADAGLGADEFEGPRRCTRPTDRGPISDPAPRQRKAPVSSAKNTTGAIDRPNTSQRKEQL
jgi:hypothetical protein